MSDAKGASAPSARSAWPQFALPDLGRAVKGAHPAAARISRLDAACFDTSDLRLLRRGVTLRFRRGEAGGDVWTLKLPSEGAALGLSRREISLPGAASAMPRLLRDLARGWALGAPLGRTATIRSTRTTTLLLDADELPIATIDDDVCGLRGRHAAARFREIEIELAPDAPNKALHALTKSLSAAGAMPAAQVPKLARTLGPAGRTSQRGRPRCAGASRAQSPTSSTTTPRSSSTTTRWPPRRWLSRSQRCAATCVSSQPSSMPGPQHR